MAIAVGVVVFSALAVVAAVVYPAVARICAVRTTIAHPGGGRRANDNGTAQAGCYPLGQLVPFGDSELQILPAAAVGPTNGFVGITGRDVLVASGTDKPYFHDEAYAGVVYRIYTEQFGGTPETLVRVAVPVSDATSTQTALGWLLTVLVPSAAVGAALVARLAAGRVLRPVGRLTETVERIRDTGDLSAPIEAAGQDEISRLGRHSPP